MAELLAPTDAPPDAPDAGPLPPPPDFARYIPDSVVAQAQAQDDADKFAQAAQQHIADVWDGYASDSLDRMVQNYMAVSNWQPPTPYSMPSEQPAETSAPAAPEAPQPVDGGNLIDRFMGGMGSLVDKLTSGVTGIQNNQPVGPGNQGVAASAPAVQEAVQGAPAEVLNAAANPLAAGIDVLNSVNEASGGPGPVPTPEQAAQQGLISPGQAAAASLMGGLAANGPEALAAPVAGVADLAKAGAGAVRGAVNDAKLAQGLGNIDIGIAGGSEAIPKEALTADHPIVQAVAQASEQAGRPVNPEAVAKLIASKGFNPENMAKAAGRLDATQTAALASYKAAQDHELASALMKAANPDADAAAWDAIPGISGRQGGIDLPETPSSSEPSIENLAKAGSGDTTVGAPYTGAGYSKLAESPAIQGLNAVQGVLKQSVLAGSVFHPLVESAQLGRTALAEMKPVAGAKGIASAVRSFADSPYAQKLLADNADVIGRAEQAGATNMRFGSPVSTDMQQVGNRVSRTLLSSAGSGVMGYASGRAQGETNEEALGRAAIFAAGGAGIAQLAPAINAKMWGQMVPVAKLQAYKMLEPAYGARVAAKRINDTFGGQNLAKLGRNPEMQTVLRTTFLAPDWLESWARNLGAVVKPGPEGTAARKWWAATGISGALSLEGMNVALTGHSTFDNEPGRQMQLEITPIVHALGGDPRQRYYADVLQMGPVGSVLNAAAKGGIGAVGANLATGHLNMVPDIAYAAQQNFAPTGGQIVSQGTPPEQAVAPEIAAALAHAAPIGTSTLGKSAVPLPVGALSAATGIRTAAGPAGTPAKPKAANPLAPSAGRPAPKNMANLRSFLSGPAVKAANPMAPAAAGNNLKKLGALK